jgi:parallel beta-helix repeat protein
VCHAFADRRCRLNNLLANGGDGYILSLCPSAQYIITAPILFAAPNQEISTAGYPSDATRATLVVDGPVADGAGHTTAIDGTCATCSGIKIRHIQVNGTRLGAPPTSGGANIEIGGANTGQLVEFTHSFDPRSWSCLHIAEGGLSCANATIQNNDIGPAGSDAFQQWADGISNACAHSTIRNNMVNNPTDGGIVLFGAPGTQVYNNTVWVETVGAVIVLHTLPVLMQAAANPSWRDQPGRLRSVERQLHGHRCARQHNCGSLFRRERSGQR